MSTSSKIGQNNLINSCLQIFEKSLCSSFKTSISQTLAELFNLAEHASSNQQETSLFEQYNLLKKSTGKLLDSLVIIIKSMPDEITEQLSQNHEFIKLSIIEDEILEISLSLTQMESVLDIKFTKYLFALEKRLKILFASKNITKDNMPFGVSSVCWIISQTLDLSESDVKTKTLFIDILKKQLIVNLLDVYKEIDKRFVNAGILPNIKIEHKPIRRKDSSLQKKNMSSQDLALTNDGAEQFADKHGAPLSNEFDRKESGNLVNSIFDLMNQGRVPNNQSSQLTTIDDQRMDQTLENLSKITSVAAGGTEIDKLKEMILDDVRNETGIYYPGLNRQQQNSLDVMGMFYDQIKQDNSIDSNILSSLNAINIPLLRTSIKDDSFFEKSSHPARQYLEKIIYAAQKWHGTSVVKNLHKFSSNVASEYDGSNESFDNANEDLENYLKLTELRAKKSEEKWVNSVKGKEKLDNSRKKVSEVVEEISQDAVPDFVKNVIKYVAQDALTLSLLRHGEDSEEWNKNIKMSSSIAKMANPEKIKYLTPKQKIESLHHLDQTMDDLGFSENDRKTTLNNIKECAEAATNNKLDKEIELGNVASIDNNKENVQKVASTKIEDIRELSGKEKTELTKIKLMPYGTLFDFIINQQRDKIRRKLSWFSPVSNKALFVSLMGNKPFEKSLNAVAIDLARNNIIVVKIEEKKYFNDVLANIFSKLKNMISHKDTGTVH